jgi:serine/threonine protein phosphatase PrpC
MKSRFAGLTDVGKVRSGNEDNLLLQPAIGLFAVADGMGGHAAGEVASRMAIETLDDSIGQNGLEGLIPESAGERLVEAFQQGNRKICDSVQTRDEWRGMGTTIVALMTVGDQAVIGHVGDSRAYLLRGGELQRLTNDHSWVSEQVRLGLMTDDEAHKHPLRNIVTRAMGNRIDLQVELTRHAIEEGDLFLLCSDGLNSMLGDDHIQELLRANQSDPEAACRALVDAANQKGGEDNVTVIVVAAEGDDPEGSN